MAGAQVVAMPRVSHPGESAAPAQMRQEKVS
jgi:hypothetical protein